MTDASQTPDRSPEKPTEQWVTGDEPMTGPQQSYLATLAREAGEEVPDGLTKAQASEMIERMQLATGRGGSGDQPATSSGDLADRVQAEGIVDQQAAFLDDDADEANPT
jgi:hypothetical protein